MSEQLALDLPPVAYAPPKVRRHGLVDAHERPLVSKGKQRCGEYAASFRVHPAKAWRFPALELRAGNSWPALILDADSQETIQGGQPVRVSGVERLLTALQAGSLPLPNWWVVRESSGGAHAVYTLGRPVHRGGAARRAPLKLYGRVSEYLGAIVDSDSRYAGVLTHNPMSRSHRGPGGADLRTTWGRREPYSLPELAGCIPSRWRQPATPRTEGGRNCALFEALMQWAGSPANLTAAAAPVALALNAEFDVPLDFLEVVGIARSVERYRRRWIARGQFGEAGDLERAAWGRQRGIRSGDARRQRTADRDAAIVRRHREGASQPRLAREFGLDQTTILRILRRDLPPAVERSLFEPG